MDTIKTGTVRADGMIWYDRAWRSAQSIAKRKATRNAKKSKIEKSGRRMLRLQQHWLWRRVLRLAS